MTTATTTIDGVLLDFDGTLTRRDTMLGFLVHAGRRSPARGLLLALYAAAALLPWALWPGGRSALLSGALWIVSVGRGRPGIHALLRGYVDALVADRPRLLAPAVVAAARAHLEAGRALWVVSGSSPLWIREVLAAEGLRARVIGSRARLRAGGLVLERRCVGREKVRRIAADTRGRTIRWRHAYGDAASDRPMLGLAERATWCGPGRPRDPRAAGPIVGR
ncbi:MAG: HAD-IB family phosphatase [Myxococcales bacterium]|nr:HAD-IB family phosphatase [Myxococcales bacterium]MCB9706344.1 HAD-IB family phosphatase [Myxococcales bacterium]